MPHTEAVSTTSIPGPAANGSSPRWSDHAACRGRTELFFPPHAERPQARVRREAKARTICQGCPVIFECRRFARVNLEYGFWGGESEEERAVAGYRVPAPIGGRARRSAI